MQQLRYPSSTKDLEKFLDRVRRSPSNVIDGKWLHDNIGISQLSNAGRTVVWLKACGVLNETGTLSERGQFLMSSESSPERRRAAVECLEALLTAETVESVRGGSITKANLSDRLMRSGSSKPVGEDVIAKAMAGFRALAAFTDEPELIGFFATTPRTPARSGAPRQTPKAKPRPVSPTPISAPELPDAGRTLAPTGQAESSNSRDRADESEQDPQPAGSQILSSGVLKISIDGTWSLEAIITVLSMLQQLERGETVAIPETIQLPTARLE